RPSQALSVRTLGALEIAMSRSATPARSVLLLATFLALPVAAAAQPTMNDPTLTVSPVIPAGSLSQPTTMDFLADNDILVLEKATGRVRRVLNNVLQPTIALDAAVNSDAERGMLGIAVDPGSPLRVFL